MYEKEERYQRHNSSCQKFWEEKLDQSESEPVVQAKMILYKYKYSYIADAPCRQGDYTTQTYTRQMQ